MISDTVCDTCEGQNLLWIDKYDGNRKLQQRYLHITCDHFFVVVVAAYETTTRTSANGIAAA
jgi:hypothetical protein